MAKFAKGSAEAKAWGAKMRGLRGKGKSSAVDFAPPGDIPKGKGDVQPAVLPHQMIRAIKNSPKGKVPPGLVKYAKSKSLIKKGK